jgi:hypothetical protein
MKCFRKYTPQTKVNVNISGGTSKFSYFYNAGYIHQGGNLKTESKDQLGYDPSSKMDRWDFRSNLDYNITNSLKAQLNIGTYIQTTNMPGVGAMYGGSTGMDDERSFLSSADYVTVSGRAYDYSRLWSTGRNAGSTFKYG